MSIYFHNEEMSLMTCYVDDVKNPCFLFEGSFFGYDTRYLMIEQFVRWILTQKPYVKEESKSNEYYQNGCDMIIEMMRKNNMFYYQDDIINHVKSGRYT